METTRQLEPNFSTLVISFASAAVLAMGLEKHPATGKIEKDLKMAQFNIDMLILLKNKTQGNLSQEETHYLDAIVTDLQTKFLQAK